jgi:2-oxoisovalerate dehydrogenase E1 component alpha subunit
MRLTEGALSHKELGLGDDDTLRMYRVMVLARTLSQKIWLLNRQGKVLFTLPCDGQEGADVGSAFALQAGKDFLVPYARDMPAVLALGMTAREVMLNHFARAADPNSGGRQMPTHWGSKRLGIISMGSPVGVTIPKAVGVALASKTRGEDSVTMACFGDGAASEGDFHEGLIFAGVMKAPVVFLCNNNGWATSVPLSKQMAGENIAMRAQSYGFQGVVVDGNDPLSVYGAAKAAVEKARQGGGPSLIEANTIRLMPHTTNDDHTRYRTPEDLAEDAKLDAIPRFREYLLASELLSVDDDRTLRAEVDAEVEEAISYAEAAPDPEPESALERIYAP